MKYFLFLLSFLSSCVLRAQPLEQQPLTIEGHIQAPENVEASDGKHHCIEIQWSRVSEGVNYRVYRKKSASSGSFKPIHGSITKTKIADFDVSPNVYYDYAVKAESSGLWSDLSASDIGHMLIKYAIDSNSISQLPSFSIEDLELELDRTKKQAKVTSTTTAKLKTRKPIKLGLSLYIFEELPQDSLLIETLAKTDPIAKKTGWNAKKALVLTNKLPAEIKGDHCYIIVTIEEQGKPMITWAEPLRIRD